MKRIVLWVLSTLSTLVVLFGYHTSTSSVMATTSEGTFSGSLQGGTSSGSGTTTGGTPPPTDATSDSTPGTVTGDAAHTRWGPVQVQLEVADSTITNVTVVQYPDSNGRDVEISNYAMPQLIQETLDSQGDSVAMVSGATYTSEGYLQSLQSALDQAGL